ncbi:MAG: glutamine--tRNA ligase/YqeY domain fusion protein [Deltaproteobacteria bacterium]|jgi:glutaminyl-tRNA synthetase|nr:glutamine--tRNA ligase/YqeY domain fusion protein [Deltaproteobacteria bacterium]
MSKEERDERAKNFIRAAIEADLAGGLKSPVVTRFPPEPNGYLHIGHAKSVCLNFGLARDFGGRTNLRFDDTNPAKEEVEYVDSIKEDVRWLGFDWEEREYYASDYFEKLYESAVALIKTGDAYVCDLTPQETREYRGTLTEPGRDSPFRGRGVAENLDLFARMRAGEFPEGGRFLRAKIDMNSPNLNMRDPALYRVKKASHHRTGDKWLIYPMYDYAHCVSDAIEGVTHSICTLEFEDHRPLYDWVLEKLAWPAPRPRQIEFARLNLEHTLMSKRKLLELVREKIVDGWDDPRLPTLAATRRRGTPPEALRLFCERIGVAKKDSWIELEWLEKAIRDVLNPIVPRVLAVLDPLKVILEDIPPGEIRETEAPFFPDEPGKFGFRGARLSREIFIERDDFQLEPARGFRRLAPQREALLRWACYVKCESVEMGPDGRPALLRCVTLERPSEAAGGKRAQRPGVIHWVSRDYSTPIVARLYDRLFRVPRPSGDFATELNPESLVTREDARIEGAIATFRPGDRYQFERLGYFVVDRDSPEPPGKPVFNRIVPLKDSWAKSQKS